MDTETTNIQLAGKAAILGGSHSVKVVVERDMCAHVCTCMDVCVHACMCMPSTVRFEGGSVPLHEGLGCPPLPSAFKSPLFPKASKSCREIKALQGQRHLKPPPYASAGCPLLLLRVGARRKMTALGVEMSCYTQQGEG